jgi:general secretion pathway protein D
MAGCAGRQPGPTGLAPAAPGAAASAASSVPFLPPPSTGAVAEPRVNGDVGSPDALPSPQIATGRGVGISGIAVAESGADLSGGDVHLDFSDTDIRDVVSQVLGDMLHVTYSIDPSVRGTATFHSTRPIPRIQLVPILQTLLAENNATLIENSGVFRVAPAAAANVPSFSSGENGSGGAVIPLQYANAVELAKILQPIVGAGARLAAEEGHNAIIITGEPESREALESLVRSFDTDLLAGQSYALLPVPNGDAKDFASTLQDAFRAQSGGSLYGLVRVLPLSRANAVLVVATNPRYLADARRVYALVARNEQSTERSWHVYYLQNSRSDDTAYILQSAFTPNDVTAQPENANPQNASSTSAVGGIGSGMGGVGSSGGSTSSGITGIGSGVNGGISGGASGVGSTGGFGGLTLNSSGGSGTTPSPSSHAASSPLVGSLEGGGEQDQNAMRIIPNSQNNAILVYATPVEYNTVEAMLRKVDLLPLQVRIDATIAEVDLNDNLAFGTQFFFKEGSVNETLSTAASGLASGLPGFQIAAAAHGVQATLSALQAVTTVKVLSSPEIMVLDNQPASLQVGALVPYLQSSAQSTLTSSADIINSVAYQPTGVLLQVTPRVNSDGLVTMDIAQEVSSVAPGTTTSGLNSPTFNDRVVKSRVVVQDGQTLGIAGLINDNITKSNSGIPFLKNIPVLGLLFGTQSNTRTRTELLVLITPHVVHDQRDAMALTQDLRDQLVNAAAVPSIAQSLPSSGSADPTEKLRQRLGLE